MFKKKMTRILYVLILAIFIGSFVVDEVQSRIDTNVPADISGEQLRAVVIEDFETGTAGGETGWQVKSEPKQFVSAETEKKLKMKNPVPVLELKFLNGFPNDMSVEEWSLTDLGKKKERCLGVKFKFRYPGSSNSIHIIPPKELNWRTKKPKYRYNPSTRKDEQENGLQLPGKARGLSMWIHARGKPYTLEVWVKDYRGDTHVFKFGSVRFVGWRPLKIKIPSSVPMETDTYPQIRVAKITRFVLRSIPNATSEDLIEETFFFFDQIKVLTDTFEVNFDGQKLDDAFSGVSTKSGNQ